MSSWWIGEKSLTSPPEAVAQVGKRDLAGESEKPGMSSCQSVTVVEESAEGCCSCICLWAWCHKGKK